MTIIRKCNCIHEFQDRTYGLQNRVMNSLADINKYRCTVCLKIHSA